MAGELKPMAGSKSLGVAVAGANQLATAVVVLDPATGLPSSGGGGGGGSTALPAGTGRSGTITAGGTAQVLAAANAARLSLTGQNISAGDLWINEQGGTAAVGAAGSYRIAPDGTFEISTNRAISIIGATTGQAFTATET